MRPYMQSSRQIQTSRVQSPTPTLVSSRNHNARGVHPACAGIRSFLEIELTFAWPSTWKTLALPALRRSILIGKVHLRDDIVEVEDPSTHGVELHIDQFARFFTPVKPFTGAVPPGPQTMESDRSCPPGKAKRD